MIIHEDSREQPLFHRNGLDDLDFCVRAFSDRKNEFGSGRIVTAADQAGDRSIEGRFNVLARILSLNSFDRSSWHEANSTGQHRQGDSTVASGGIAPTV